MSSKFSFPTNTNANNIPFKITSVQNQSKICPNKSMLTDFYFSVGGVSYVTNIKNENAKQSKYSLLMGILISETKRRIITCKSKDAYQSASYSTLSNSQLKAANC